MDDGWEIRALCARWRVAADRWALSPAEAARLLGVGVDVAEPLLRAGVAVALTEASETRMRLVIEVDRSLGLRGFDALVWLRLDGSPSRLARMSGSMDGLRQVRREAEAR